MGVVIIGSTATSAREMTTGRAAMIDPLDQLAPGGVPCSHSGRHPTCVAAFDWASYRRWPRDL